MFVLGCQLAADASSDPVLEAVRFFEGLMGHDVDTILRTLRPPQGTDERVRAIALLPDRGEVFPDRSERAKLAQLTVVLTYHERAGVLDVKVIDVPQAAVALHFRSVLVISRPVLRLVSAAELQALVAHEIGHDYFWRDFEETFVQGDKNGLRELELRCDGVAVLTMIGLRAEPLALIDALRKIAQFNEVVGATANADEYPPLPHRQQFVKELRQRYGALRRPIGPRR